MNTYYMTGKRQNHIGFWHPCKATTLASAKAEATRQYHQDFDDTTIMIAVGDGIREERTVIATRPNTAKGKWRTL